MSARRVALGLTVAAVLWDGYWMSGLLRANPGSSTAAELFWLSASLHLAGLLGFFAPKGRWLGGLLAVAALLFVAAGLVLWRPA